VKKTAAWLAVHALEKIGVRLTFGIPGVHNTELYDELNNSNRIRPVLVTHEGGASFMADAVSRISDSIGTLVIVPAAGATHAASGIGEAFLDGIPMLIITGGIRTDLDKGYQLHEIDQVSFMRGLTKACFKIERHDEVVPTIYEAYRIAVSGEPGPVLIEIPVNLQLMPGEVGDIPSFTPPASRAFDRHAEIARAADILLAAKRPALFAGWGARGAKAALIAIAEHLQAPVATTLQGLSVFPSEHPLHVGFGFGEAAVPAARNAFAGSDALLAVATRFAEIATGSFGATVPPALVHIDINPKVFGRNHKTEIAIEADAQAALSALLAELRRRGPAKAARLDFQEQIRRDKQAYVDEWLVHDRPGRVNPARFFLALRQAVPDDVVAVVDDGNHTYLTAELFPVRDKGRLILPTDFNAMGYAVPAAIGAKLSLPEAEVFAIVGDGAFTMTCMELVTASSQGLGIVVYVFHDGELSQIAQAQQIPYNRKTCTALGALNIEGVALAVGGHYLRMASNAEIDKTIAEARRLSQAGKPVIVDIDIDYSKRTAFTKGAVKTNFRRFPLAEKLRLASRALARRVTG